MNTEILFIINLVAKKFRNGDMLVFKGYGGMPVEISSGKVTLITGENGIGKSTLVNMLGLLDRARILHDGILRYVPEEIDYGKYNSWRDFLGIKTSKIRRRNFGFSPQAGHLIDVMTIRENLMAALYIKADNEDVESDCNQALEGFIKYVNTSGSLNGTRDYWDLSPAMLSGGGRQLLALKRAVRAKPRVLFVDEPTNNMGQWVVEATINILKDYIFEQNGSVILITHDWERIQKMLDQDRPVPNQRIYLKKSDDDLQKTIYKSVNNVKTIVLVTK